MGILPQHPKPNTAWKFPNGVYYWHGDIQIDPSSIEGQQIITILNQQYMQKLPSNQPQYGQACYQFDIHCEDGASQINVILKAADFELLKQDTHIMAVINIKQLVANPTTTYLTLSHWIVEHSITKVPT